MVNEPPPKRSLIERLRRLVDKANDRLLAGRRTVRIALLLLGMGLIAVLGAAAWPILMELRSEHIAAADPRPAYVSRVREKIQKATEAALAGMPARNPEGYLQLRIEVNAAGELVSAKVQQSSGDAALDQLALRIVRDASPFGQFPPDMRRSTKGVLLTSEFHFQ
jgi:TonB family protein